LKAQLSVSLPIYNYNRYQNANLFRCIAAVTSEAATLLSKVVAKGNSVRGVTLLGNKLFVVRCPSLQQIEVYDSATFVLLRPLLVPGFVGVPHGVTSCSTNNCLYVSDYSSLSCSGAVFRIELRGDANVVKNWRVNGCPNGLSVNGNGHVIVAVRSAGDVDRIMEISTHGSLIREIRLQPEVTKIWHAVQLTGDLFVVSHGERGDRSLGDVCIVQVRMGANELKPADGLVKLRFRKNPGVATTAISEPTQVATDQNGCVFVADRDNNRILTLDRSLIGASVVPVTIDGGLQGPCALFLDESRERLYVGEWNGGRVLVFDDIFSGCR
jgi:DNA-binding beta-propeller fold protein YncE